MSKIADEERQKRPDYRPVIEYDGFLRHRSSNQVTFFISEPVCIFELSFSLLRFVTFKQILIVSLHNLHQNK